MLKNQLFPVIRAFALTFVVASCGFTPVYAPGTGTVQTLSTIEVEEPKNQNSYLFVRAMEDRLGRSANADKLLKYKVTIKPEGVESDNDRRRVVGVTNYRVVTKGTNKVLASGAVNSFAGYSVSDGLFAGARQDAVERLITIMADQITREVIIKLAAP